MAIWLLIMGKDACEKRGDEKKADEAFVQYLKR